MFVESFMSCASASRWRVSELAQPQKCAAAVHTSDGGAAPPGRSCSSIILLRGSTNLPSLLASSTGLTRTPSTDCRRISDTGIPV